MNKQRKSEIESVASILEDASNELQLIIDDEQDAFDALPDSLQSSSRGEKMQQWIDDMEALQSEIDAVRDRTVALSQSK